MQMNSELQARLAYGRRRIRERFWAQRNVVSLGVGARQRNEEWTDEPAITVGVVKKRKAGYLRADEILPRELDIDGVSHRVDVVEVGEITFDGPQEFVPPDWRITERTRPLQAGTQIANVTNVSGNGFFAGTLGCFVMDSEEKLYILSNHHVLVNMGTDIPVLGHDILQPATSGSDYVVARLYSYIGLQRGIGTTNQSDAALAKLIDQDHISTVYPGNRMEPPSQMHQAVGLYFASNSDHSRGFICRINPMLRGLGVRMLWADSTHEVDGYNMFDPIDKVGARTGYSSTKIVDIDSEAKVRMSNGKSYNFENLIATERMGWGGDSGSLVCLGGDGTTIVPLEHVDESSCFILESIRRMYDMPPINADIPLADRIRDEFLSLSRVGSLLTHVFYLNSETVRSRADQSQTSDYEKAAARSLYDKYRNFVESAMNAPQDPSYVVTQEHLDDTAQAINGASLHMYSEESSALTGIYNNVIRPTLGMRYADLLSYMNDDAVYHAVLDRLVHVSTIVTEGIIGGK